MEQKLIYTINGKNYLLFEVKVDSSTADNLLDAVTKYKGIYLGEGLEDACWEGYEAIGTKMLDGREVPNCVPTKD